MGSAVVVEKTEEELRREIDELHRQQREISERLRDPRGIRRGGLSNSGPRNFTANGGRQRGFVRPAERNEMEDQPAAKRRLSSAVVKLEDGEIADDGFEAAKDVKREDLPVEIEDTNASQSGKKPSLWPQRDGNKRPLPSKMDFEIPPAEHVPRVLPKDDDPSLVSRNKRMLGQLLGTLESFRKEDKQLSGTEAYMRRSDSLKRAEQRAREESEKLRQQEREQIAEKRKRDLTLRARIAAKAEEKKLESLFLRRSEHHKKLGNFTRHTWYRNIATLYRRRIHHWRSTDRYPEMVSEPRWAAWTAAWQDERWLDRAEKNKANRNNEPASPGTGTSKHIAGSKTYNGHYQSMRAARQGADPTSWDLYLHTHRRPDESFVDERSRMVHQSMGTYLDESLTPPDDGTIPSQPSSEEVNSMFKNVVGGPKKGRMYGCGSMASTIYPHDMAPRPRGVGIRSSSSSQELNSMRKTIERQSKIIEFMRVDLQALQMRDQKRDKTEKKMKKQNKKLKGRVDTMEDQLRRLVSGIPQVPPVGSSRGDCSAATSSRADPRGKRLARTFPPSHRLSQQWVDQSQDFGADEDEDEDDGDDDGAYDDDETQTP